MTPNAFVESLDELVSAALARISASSSASTPAADVSVSRLLRIALRNELEAAEEAAVWLVDERDVEVKLALMRQCGDEARHYRLVEARLRVLGDDLAGFNPLAQGYTPMFDFLRSLPTTVERIAAGPFAREALAGVRNAVFIEYLSSLGDEETARMYRDDIQPDEAHHHRLGRTLLLRFAVDDESQRRARAAAERTLSLAEELQEIARLKLGIARAPGC